MNISSMFELSCAFIASQFKGKSFEQVKKDYGLDDETYTPEEEEELMNKFPWIV